MASIRKPAVAGAFYPGDSHGLRAAVAEYLEGARASFSPTPTWPKAIIVPHAGYIYSGSVAASAYARLLPGREVISRVVLIGPSHRVPFRGLAIPSSQAFETPLGRVPVDETARRSILALPFVIALDEAHRDEHALEVQLPFLQEILETFAVLPVAVGRAAPEQVSEVLDALWGGDETIVAISSDLSHYHDYDTAKRMDAATADAIERLEPSRIAHDDACGRIGVQGLLKCAERRGLRAERLDLRNSGDTAGGRREVVGYGAWAFSASRNDLP